MSRLVVVLVLAAGAGPAAAQPAPDPVDPYGDPDVGPPLDVTVARALVARARQLLDADFPADAKQLAEEALVRSTDAGVVAEARAIISLARRALGITDAPPPIDPPVDPPPVDPPPIEPPPRDLDVPPPPRDDLAAGRRAMVVHGIITGAAFGGGLGLAIEGGDGAAGAAIGAAAGASIGVFAGRWAARRWKLDDAEARTIGSGSMVGAVALGLFADVVDVGGTSPSEVGIGISVGALAGAAGGALLSRRRVLSTGDVAVMDSFALYGVVGGLTIGLAMQPAEDEAYSLNAIIGGVGGWLVGAVLGPKIDASPRRVTRMMLGAALLGGAPWLLYATTSDSSTTADERTYGLLSSAGIIGGAYLGYRFSKNLAGDEVQPGKKKPPDAEDAAGATAMFRRDRRGTWTIGASLPRPAVVDGQRGWVLDVAGGSF